MSTTFSVPTNLTSTTYFNESTSALRFTLWVSFFFLIFLIISTSISKMCFNACASSILNKNNLSYRPVKFRQRMFQEDFDNSQYEQGKEFEFDYKTASKYESIALNSPEDYPSTLIIGQVNRYYKTENDKINIIIDVFSNLYILGGNVYGDTKEDQEYRVYAYNSQNNKIDLGKLVKSPDNMYKLKITSNDPNLLNYNNIEIVYKTSNSETTLLTGKFN
jgi:hypothetical protein